MVKVFSKTKESQPSSRSCFFCVSRFLAVVFLTSVVFIFVAWVAREPILRSFTHMWVIDEEYAKADITVVLGGGANTRTFAAAQAYNDGYVKRILIPNVKKSPIAELGLIKTEAELCFGVVSSERVPESAISFFGEDVSSTWEELSSLKEWALSNEVSSILLFTEFPYTRRLRWVADKVFADHEIDVFVSAIDALDFTEDNWWSEESGLISFQNEVVKYVIYLVKY